jgi:hypothetical protein
LSNPVRQHRFGRLASPPYNTLASHQLHALRLRAAPQHRQLIASPRPAPPCRTRAASLRGSALVCIPSLATSPACPVPPRISCARAALASLSIRSDSSRPKGSRSASPRLALPRQAPPRLASPRLVGLRAAPPAACGCRLATPSLSQRPALPRLPNYAPRRLVTSHHACARFSLPCGGRAH